MLQTTNKNSRGFTIVELLIVIVVIAILAAISIVAYNGIQQRARNTTNSDSASQLKTKIEAWNSIMGSYPNPTVLSGGLTSANASEAKIDASLQAKVQVDTTGTPTAPSAALPVVATPCGLAGTAPNQTVTGISVRWRVEPTQPSDGSDTVTLGVCP